MRRSPVGAHALYADLGGDGLMGYRLGVDLGTTFTAAAYVEDRAPRMLELGNRNVSVPSVLFFPMTASCCSARPPNVAPQPSPSG